MKFILAFLLISVVFVSVTGEETDEKDASPAVELAKNDFEVHLENEEPSGLQVRSKAEDAAILGDAVQAGKATIFGRSKTEDAAIGDAFDATKTRSLKAQSNTDGGELESSIMALEHQGRAVNSKANPQVPTGATKTPSTQVFQTKPASFRPMQMQMPGMNFMNLPSRANHNQNRNNHVRDGQNNLQARMAQNLLQPFLDSFATPYGSTFTARMANQQQAEGDAFNAAGSNAHNARSLQFGQPQEQQQTGFNGANNLYARALAGSNPVQDMIARYSRWLNAGNPMMAYAEGQ